MILNKIRRKRSFLLKPTVSAVVLGGILLFLLLSKNYSYFKNISKPQEPNGNYSSQTVPSPPTAPNPSGKLEMNSDDVSFDETFEFDGIKIDLNLDSGSAEVGLKADDSSISAEIEGSSLDSSSSASIDITNKTDLGEDGRAKTKVDVSVDTGDNSSEDSDQSSIKSGEGIIDIQIKNSGNENN